MQETFNFSISIFLKNIFLQNKYSIFLRFLFLILGRLWISLIVFLRSHSCVLVGPRKPDSFTFSYSRSFNAFSPDGRVLCINTELLFYSTYVCNNFILSFLNMLPIRWPWSIYLVHYSSIYTFLFIDFLNYAEPDLH